MSKPMVEMSVLLPKHAADSLRQISALARVKPEVVLRVILALSLPKPPKEGA
jgi:hypothetical protein